MRKRRPLPTPVMARIRTHFLALSLALPHAVALGAGQAEVAVSLDQEEPPWAGEQVVVNLDLKTDDLSFANVFFNLPAVERAFLLRTDSNTVKLTERRGRETWQVLRYPVALFPQAGGELTVPAIEVRFDTTAGFGSEPTSHTLTTEPLTVAVRRPPGVADGAIVVTSPDHTLEQDWTSPPDPVEAGDAFTLTVHRRAADISAMFLPPLPVYETGGLGAYPATPDIRDRSNRGRIVGERTDRITWIVEQPGDYVIPAIRFQWWDPDAERLRNVQVEGLSFSAAPAPGQPTTDAAEAAGARDGGRRETLLAVLALLTIGWVTASAWRFRTALLRLGRRILPPPRALLKDLNPGPSS